MTILRVAWPQEVRHRVSSTAVAKTKTRHIFIVSLAQSIQSEGQTELTSVCPDVGTPAQLEIQPEGKLNQPGIVQLLIDYAETGSRIYILLPEIGNAAHKELWVVK